MHQVAPSMGLQVENDGYRVSFSMNLNGEWGDTGATVYSDVRYHTRKNEQQHGAHIQELPLQDEL